MFKEILQIIPKLAPTDLNNMERTLTRRFANVAKKFGKGLGASLLGGGLAGAALGILDKILNPLKEVQETIDNMLRRSDDIATNAKQFGTTSGKLARLQALAQSTGVDQGNLDMLITKFSTAVAEARQDKTKPSAVRAFANDTDMAESFFNFIQSLQRVQKTDPKKALLIQQEIFGEKQILKIADFLQTDFKKQLGLLGGPSAEKLTPAIEKAADLNDLKDRLAATQSLNDLVRKSALINEGMIREQAAAAKRNQDAEDMKIQSYQSLAAISKTSDTILNTVTQAALSLTDIVTKFTDLSKKMDAAASWGESIKNLLKWRGGK